MVTSAASRLPLLHQTVLIVRAKRVRTASVVFVLVGTGFALTLPRLFLPIFSLHGTQKNVPLLVLHFLVSQVPSGCVWMHGVVCHDFVGCSLSSPLAALTHDFTLFLGAWLCYVDVTPVISLCRL